MNGRPYHRTGPITPHPDVERVERWSRWFPLWLALAAFVAFATIVGGARLLAAPAPVERPASP